MALKSSKVMKQACTKYQCTIVATYVTTEAMTTANVQVFYVVYFKLQPTPISTVTVASQ